MKRTFNTVILIISFVIANHILIAGNGEGKSGTTENKSNNISSTFIINSIKVSKEGFVSWTAANEQGSLPYTVEQYIFDKWVKVAEISGVGTPTPNSYSVPVVLHSGENKFRVKQKGYDKMSRFSDIITYYSKKEAINYSILDKNQTLSFSGDTYYIIYDPYGVILKQGYGNSVDISNYKKGYYCLVYDNKLGGFVKKKVLFKNSFCPIVINRWFIFKRK